MLKYFLSMTGFFESLHLPVLLPTAK